MWVGAGGLDRRHGSWRVRGLRSVWVALMGKGVALGWLGLCSPAAASFFSRLTECAADCGAAGGLPVRGMGLRGAVFGDGFCGLVWADWTDGMAVGRCVDCGLCGWLSWARVRLWGSSACAARQQRIFSLAADGMRCRLGGGGWFACERRGIAEGCFRRRILWVGAGGLDRRHGSWQVRGLRSVWVALMGKGAALGLIRIVHPVSSEFFFRSWRNALPIAGLWVVCL